MRAPDAVARVAMAAPSACASARDALVAGARPRPGGTPREFRAVVALRQPLPLRTRRVSPPRARPHNARALAGGFPPRGSPLGGDVRATPRADPRLAPALPARRPAARVVARCAPPDDDAGAGAGASSGDAVPENREQPDDTSSNPRALALRTNPRARDQIQTPGREQTPFLLLSLRGGQPHPSLAARPQPRASEAPRDQSATATDPLAGSQNQKAPEPPTENVTAADIISGADEMAREAEGMRRAVPAIPSEAAKKAFVTAKAAPDVAPAALAEDAKDQQRAREDPAAADVGTSRGVEVGRGRGG